MNSRLCISLLLASIYSPAITVAQGVDFVREVRPIFQKHCYSCHGPEKQKSGYRLDIKSIAIKGGDNHSPVIVPGKPLESPLIRMVKGVE
ncbi:MAG: c-type cytochrome domain-containing protein, partial [Gemmataceae bacterium]